MYTQMKIKLILPDRSRDGQISDDMEKRYDQSSGSQEVEVLGQRMNKPLESRRIFRSIISFMNLSCFSRLATFYVSRAATLQHFGTV